MDIDDSNAIGINTHCHANHNVLSLLTNKTEYSKEYLIVGFIGQVMYEGVYVYYDDSKYKTAAEFVNSIPIRNYPNYWVSGMDCLNLTNQGGLVHLNIDKFNELMPDLTLQSTYHKLRLSYVRYNIRIDHKLSEFDRFTEQFSAFVKEMSLLALIPDYFFNNLQILSKLEHGCSGDGSMYLDFDQLPKYSVLEKFKLPEINDINCDIDGMDRLINMLISCKFKRNHEKKWSSKTITMNYIKFIINYRYCKINFFGITYTLYDDASIAAAKTNTSFKYAITFLLNCDNVHVLLNKLEIQLLL